MTELKQKKQKEKDNEREKKNEKTHNYDQASYDELFKGVQNKIINVVERLQPE